MEGRKRDSSHKNDRVQPITSQSHFVPVMQTRSCKTGKGTKRQNKYFIFSPKRRRSSNNFLGEKGRVVFKAYKESN
ncbi:hypothetical protein PNOK_0847800 [Pyrrhoderma noxium]|uniref:Uncharacterized protein n=1 Tax=Pyrrhoderma noxium TaxID=2282107 RepID=A0A286U7R9_9AGAM|nr:hypothetical protein PNOK_0847800 [Pyrrhoderma noxium]